MRANDYRFGAGGFVFRRQLFERVRFVAVGNQGRHGQNVSGFSLDARAVNRRGEKRAVFVGPYVAIGKAFARINPSPIFGFAFRDRKSGE